MAFNSSLASAKIRSTAGLRSSGHCGRDVREALAAGGIILDRREHACQYGSSLVNAGFTPVGSITSGFQAGDVVVINCSATHIHGHMALYDGTQWISDFYQNGLSIYHHMPNYTIYRYGGQ